MYHSPGGFIALSSKAFEVGGLRLPILPIFYTLCSEYGFSLNKSQAKKKRDLAFEITVWRV